MAPGMDLTGVWRGMEKKDQHADTGKRLGLGEQISEGETSAPWNLSVFIM